MLWWWWILGGIGLLAFEIATPGGLFALFFGVGALLVAPLSALDASIATQWFAFTLFSLIGLMVIRAPLMRRLMLNRSVRLELVGEQAVLLGELAVGGEGKAELRGVPWTARTASTVALSKGQRCIVEKVDGLTLWLRPE
jgi:membrane protein implicated in regulation of membrane protease activity